MTREKRTRGVVLASIALVLSLYTTAARIWPQTVGFDAAVGFLTLQGMRAGAPLNCLVIADPTDISKNLFAFNAWWSPGQYAIPGLLSTTGISLADAALLTVLLSTIAGLCGYARLWRALGVRADIRWWSLGALSLSSVISVSFAAYDGGEILLFGAVPWIVLASLRCRSLGWWEFPVVASLFLIGMFLKLSFVACTLGIAASVFLRALFGRELPTRVSRIVYAVKLTALCAGVVAVVNWFFVSKGAHPTFIAFDFSFVGFLHPFAGGLLSALLIGELARWNLSSSLLPGTVVMATLILGAVGSGALLWKVWISRWNRPEYASVALGFGIAYLVLFLFFYLGDYAVNHDGRHFRALGIVWLPLVVEFTRSRASRPLRWLTAAILAGACAAGPAKWVILTVGHTRAANVGRLGFTQNEVSREAVRALHALDASFPQGDALFDVPTPQVSLEIRDNRRISQHLRPDDDKFLGRVANVFVFLPADPALRSEVESRLAMFVGYPRGEWRHLALGSTDLYFQSDRSTSEIEGIVRARRF